MRKKFAILLVLMLLVVTFCGCSTSSNVSDDDTDTTKTSTIDSAATSDASTDTSDVSADTSDDSTNTSDVSADTDISQDDMFTARDLRTDYDESECIAIQLSDDSSSCDNSLVSISGDTIRITGAGTYLLTGKLTDGCVVVDAGSDDKVQLILAGVSISNSSTAAIYIKQADKVFITLADESENKLSHSGEYVSSEDETGSSVDAVIFSRDDLTLNGTGSLTINSESGHGIVSKDDLVITGGEYIITADKHALCGKDSLRIADGTFNLNCGSDALHSENDEDDELGYIYILDGSFVINAGDDGIHAGYSVTICGGDIDIEKSYEGIEGLTINISGGVINLVSSDDGLNAAGGNDLSGSTGRGMNIFSTTLGASINIRGGSLNINASGDGIDSNGDLYISGGYIYVDGPTNGGNGALDYNGTARITGGTVITVEGSTSMALNFGSSSTQGSILVAVSGDSSDEIILSDANGNVLVQVTPGRTFNVVLISCPELSVGETYTLKVGSTETEITLESIIYTSKKSTQISNGSGTNTGGSTGTNGNTNRTGGITGGNGSSQNTMRR